MIDFMLEHLLAKKIVVGRPQDVADAKTLIQYIGLSDPKDVLRIVEQYFPPRYITAKVQYCIEALFTK